MITPPTLTIRSLQARPVNVPMAHPLHTSGGVVGTAPLVLINLQTEEGITGTAYLFCYTPLALKPVAQLLHNLEAVIKGEIAAPFSLERKLQARFRLLGPQGLTAMAMAGIDMAGWDALAKAANMPLVRLLGGALTPIPAYNSCGLGIIGAERAATEAVELVAPGFKALKIRLGYSNVAADIAVIRAVKQAVGENILLMADYNQSLTIPEAMTRIRALENEGLNWVEEPIQADDYAGYAQIRQTANLPIQLGENWWGTHDMSKSLAAGASDLVMPDVMKIGGVTGWLRAAALAEAAGLPMSGHLFPEISAQLLAVTPTRHWLEYVDFANPILQEPIKIENGHAIIPDVPGVGLSWNEEAVEQFLV